MAHMAESLPPKPDPEDVPVIYLKLHKARRDAELRSWLRINAQDEACAPLAHASLLHTHLVARVAVHAMRIATSKT